MANDRAPRWATLTLAPGGRSLIEASAGTGKTWTIAVLYLRLVLEGDGLSPRQIVVTTFTDAAAQELRERIRAGLIDAARHAAAHGAMPVTALAAAGDGDDVGNEDGDDDDDGDGNDRVLTWLQARWTNSDCLASDRLRLQLALAELDQAPIGTLHALCRRVLSEHPFESGSAIGLGDTVDGSALDDELADDAWRRLVQAPELGFGDLLWLRAGRRALRACLRAVLQPGVSLRPAPSLDTIDRAALAADIRDWQQRIRSKGRKLQRGLTRLAEVLEQGAALDVLDDADVDDLLSPIDKGVAKESLAAATAHPVAAFLAALARARESALDRYRSSALGERARRLAARNQLGFDDLIVRVRDAIDAHPALANALFHEWPVALVDEFQDTDERQFRILDRIYRDADGASRGRLVMIGDPKQAIYRFRGGDIGAYRRAALSADETIALDTNFRSADAYVAALNELFERGGAALSSDPVHAIAYQRVKPGGRRRKTPLTFDGAPVARPLMLHLATDVPDSQGERERIALEACANHIATLLAERRHAIAGRPLAPGDIAVLLPTNGQVATMRRLLQRRGVPCVGSARSSVFAGDWARELQIVLHAAWHPRDVGAVRAALASRLLGQRFVDLARLDDEPQRWHAEATRFDVLHRRWQQAGVLAVVRDLIAAAAPRLLAMPDGERALTDLRHLGELLQAASDTLAGGPALLAWLQRQRDGDDAGSDTAAEERSLRIESDARRVTLMTLHASKGLEFPLVFLPLMWKHGARGGESFWLVDHGAGGRVLSFDRDAHKPGCDVDAQDERFRVLYVALTRAVHACHVYALPWDRPADGGRGSGPARDPARSALDCLLERLHAAHGDPPAIVAATRHLGYSLGWPWTVPAEGAPAVVAAPRRQALIEPTLRSRPLAVHSFSTLVRPAALAMDAGPANDEDSVEEAGESVAAASGAIADAAGATTALPGNAGDAAPSPAMHALPHPQLAALAELRGTEFGNALHAIFEHRRIGQPMARQHALIRDALREHGVRLGGLPLERAVELIAARVQACLDSEILPGLVLGALPADALRAEMSFHFALDGVALAALRRVCAEHGEPALVPAGRMHTLHGLMTGKIDLVLRVDGRFHVLDYKGNRLGRTGDRLADYLPDSLDTAMDHSHYRFQALLYTLAVDRLLRQRLHGYDRASHLGEAIYLFVRAVGLAPGAGVWRHRFDDALIDAVDAVLAGRSEEVA